MTDLQSHYDSGCLQLPEALQFEPEPVPVPVVGMILGWVLRRVKPW
jgi:hypothetical protein